MSGLNPFILLHPDDNVLVCRVHVMAGQIVFIDDSAATLHHEITVGHKVARIDLSPGDKVIKYGAAIGSITQPVHKGDHVHMHNMQSDYIKSHTRAVTGHDH